MSKSFRSPSKILRRLKLTPLAARKLASWPRFMFNYSLGLVPRDPYTFRNGARLMIGRGVDHAPIIEIFLREEYGRVSDGATILDVGASIGTFSVYAGTGARAVRIFSYEPMPDYFSLMQQNIRRNQLDDRVKCFNCGVAADAGTRQLTVESATFMFPTLTSSLADGPGRKIDIPCTTLSDIIDANNIERVDLLKMDCEGSEYEILYGAPKRCLQQVREIRMEYHNIAGDRRNGKALGAFLSDHGYEIVMLSPDSGAQASGNLWARKHG
jgi:FkbM family methyltransferase